jgi:hypothetical protein
MTRNSRPADVGDTVKRVVMGGGRGSQATEDRPLDLGSAVDLAPQVLNLGVDVRKRAVGWSGGVYLGGSRGAIPLRRVSAGSAGRSADFQGLEDGGLGFRHLGALPEGAGGAGEGADVDLVEFAARFWPRGATGRPRDPGQQGCQPAEDNVGADPVFPPVPDGAQVGDLLHVFQPRSASSSCLYPTAMSSTGRFGSAMRSRYFASRFPRLSPSRRSSVVHQVGLTRPGCCADSDAHHGSETADRHYEQQNHRL